MTQIILMISVILFIIFSFIFNEGVPVNNWSWNVVFVIFIAGLANSLMMFFTNYGFEKITTSVASNILTLEMFFAVFLGLLVYQEIPNLKDAIGGALILFSVIKMNGLE